MKGCLVSGCDRRAPFGFRWGDKARMACLEHRADGQAWLDGIKRAGAAYTAEEGRLL